MLVTRKSLIWNLSTFRMVESLELSHVQRTQVYSSSTSKAGGTARITSSTSYNGSNRKETTYQQDLSPFPGFVFGERMLYSSRVNGAF